MSTTLDHPRAAAPDARAPCGAVVCERVGGASVLTRRYAHAPLKLLAPRPIGVAASVVMSSFGGGLVAGDDVPVTVDVGADAACVLSTQSAGKAYRADDAGRGCAQGLDARLGAGALLAVLPDPLCAFAGARLAQRQRFDLAADANLFWLDAFTSGRWARGERWRFHSLATRTDVRVDGRLVLREALRLDAALFDVADPLRVGAFDCYATLAIVGPRLRAVAAAAERVVAAVPVAPGAAVLASCAALDEHGVIVRLLGPGAQRVQQALAPIVAALADVIGADPWARKW